jgi:hypothetical protein
MAITKTCALALLGLVLACSTAQADLSISNKPTQNMSCNAGVCTPTAKNAVLNVGELTNMLAAGDLTVKSGNGDGTAAAITIADGFSWTNSSRLTLDAKNNITVKAPVSVAGAGALTLTYADGNPAGDLLFVNKGKINFHNASSSLIISGTSYTLAPDLKALATDVRLNPSGSYALMRDYDASADGIYKNAPIKSAPYGGTFEGLGHIIANLMITAGTEDAGKSPRTPANRYIGLFRYNSDLIRDINVVAASITMRKYDHRSYQGILAGDNDGTILHSYASGSVTGFNPGGLVGLNNGVISHSGADVTASGLLRAGGLAASNGGTIVGTRASGSVSVSGYGEAGGLVGGTGGTVDQSYATASVSGLTVAMPRKCCRHSYVGGLFGRNLGHVSNSYATGPVSGIPQSISGGLSGLNASGAQIAASYSTGAVSVSGTEDTNERIGGFLGHDQDGAGTLNSYWDVDTSGQQQACGNGCAGVAGLTDAQLKAGLPEGFDPKIWGSNPTINNGYPYLLANPPPKK